MPDEAAGGTERDDTVYRCRYCHAETNLVEPVGFLGNPRVRCPVTRGAPTHPTGGEVDAHHVLHAALQRLLDRRQTVDRRLQFYAGDRTVGGTVDRLAEERDLIESRVANLRTRLDGRFDDVVDAPDDGSVEVLAGSHAQVDTALLDDPGVSIPTGGDRR